MEKAVAKYLERYAEPEAQRLAAQHGSDQEFSDAIVIPVYGESVELVVEALASVHGAGPSALAVVVVNARDDSPREVHEANREVLNFLETTHSPESDRAMPFVLAIDRASSGKRLPGDEGVGLARKIGGDVVLALHAKGLVVSPWIHQSDADAIQPRDRFQAANESDALALAFPFVHELDAQDPALSEALAIYDSWLRYFVAGLAWAGSPYAHHSIGSTQSILGSVWASVRGMPRRQAGEDFYLFNKIRKLGPIEVPTSAPVRLAARRSNRVPFGTGQGVAKILAQRERGDSIRWLAPRSFEFLKIALEAAEEAVQKECPPRGVAARILEQEEAKGRGRRSECLAEALHAIGFDDGLSQVQWGPTEPARLRAFHTWFDGFRTLKFLHALRDVGVTEVVWTEALEWAEFRPNLLEKGT